MSTNIPENCKRCVHLVRAKRCAVLKELIEDCFVYRLHEKHMAEQVGHWHQVDDEVEQENDKLAWLRAILNGTST